MKGHIAAAALRCFAAALLGALSVCVSASASASEVDASSLLRARKPKEAPAGFLSADKVLNLAFYPAELVSLAAASGAAGCATNDARVLRRTSGRAEARECVEAAERQYYRNFDVIARNRTTNSIGLPSYKTNSMKVDELQRAAINRASARMASRTVSNNVVLKSVVEGKVDVDFSLDAKEPRREAPVVSRPTYSLAVNYREVQGQDVHVAALGASSFGFAGGRSRGAAALVADRQIVEVWPSVPGGTVEVASTPTSLRLGQLAKRYLGLSAEPFTNIRLRLERTGGFGLAGLSLNVEEASGVARLDLTGLLHGQKDGISWSFRLPYYAHALVLKANSLGEKTRIGYEYRPSPTLSASVTFDRNVKEGSPVDRTDSARYSLAFGYRI